MNKYAIKQIGEISRGDNGQWSVEGWNFKSDGIPEPAFWFTTNGIAGWTFEELNGIVNGGGECGDIGDPVLSFGVGLDD